MSELLHTVDTNAATSMVPQSRLGREATISDLSESTQAPVVQELHQRRLLRHPLYPRTHPSREDLEAFEQQGFRGVCAACLSSDYDHYLAHHSTWLDDTVVSHQGLRKARDEYLRQRRLHLQRRCII
jgi:hypothetical protein